MIQRIVLRRFLFVGVVAASLTLAAPGSAGATQPSRPLKLKGVATVVQTGMGFDAEGHVVIPWQLRATGEGTHVGRYTVEGSGVVTIDPATGAVTNESSGTITAASGDAIDFTGDFLDPSTVLIHLLGSSWLCFVLWLAQGHCLASFSRPYLV